ncbi:hypothetical protein QL285_026492 [Trifolium repens]|nr:hypothetical protein QL285_026492 [Trifolium repens]
MRFNPEKCTFGVRAGKFLGFYLTERGIEANPDKCRAFTELPVPHDKKSIQTLNGMLTSLSHFIAKSAQHALPLFKLLRKESAFEWTEECDQALQHLKKALSEPPVLSRPNDEEILYLYIAVASEAVSAVLIRETTEGQKPIYFTSKALQGPELRYLLIEKVALALINAARRLRHYFLAHTIVVRTDQPIKSLLSRPDMAGRMLKWSLELSEFDIRYESRKALKAQVLADFVAEMTAPAPSSEEIERWTIFVDGASSSTGAGAGIILENGKGIIIEVSLTLSFPTSNNQAEYEAFLAGLRLAEDIGVRNIKICTDSQLVVSQVLGEYQAKNNNLFEYLTLVKDKIAKFAQNKYLIVAVDYFTKWVEAEPLANIIVFNILRFFKRDVLARFGIPQVVVTDNGTQFTDKKFREFLVAINTKQRFTSVEHPQTNGQAEAANRVILRGLRRRLDDNKKRWVEELHSVLWAYRTTPHSTTGETPFRLMYGTEAIIPVEIGEPSRRTQQPLDEEMNNEALREELDLVEEIRMGASLKESTLKQKVAARHDTKVIPREFDVDSLVLRRNAKDSHEGKLAPNWEGPYRVRGKIENGAYYLEDLQGKELPRPWNAQKLKQYYS